MDLLAVTREKVIAEITQDNIAVRNKYLSRFKAEVEAFADHMSRSVQLCLDQHQGFAPDDKRTKALAIAYVAITLQIGSLKLLLSGHTVAAGNLFRQVIESIALALLASRKDLKYLDHFDSDKYSSKNAIRDVLKHRDKLGLHNGVLRALNDAQKFYNLHSHVSKITIGVSESFAGEGIYLGVAFGEAKMPYYAKEVAGRVSLSRIIPNILEVITRNLAKW